MLAVRSGNADMVRKLLEMGADPRAKDLEGNSSLHLAAANNQLGILKILFNPNLVVNCANSRGETPLSIAISSNHMKIAKYMIKHGVNAEAKLNELCAKAPTSRDLAVSDGTLVYLLVFH